MQLPRWSAMLTLFLIFPFGNFRAQTWQEPFVHDLFRPGLTLVKAKQWSYEMGVGPRCLLLEVLYGPAPRSKFQLKEYYAYKPCANQPNMSMPVAPFSQDTMFLLLWVEDPRAPKLPSPGTGMMPLTHELSAFGALHSMFPMYVPEWFLRKGMRSWLARDSQSMQALLAPLWSVDCESPGGSSDSLFYMQAMGLAWAGDLLLPVPRPFLEQSWESAHVVMRWGGIWAAAGLPKAEREAFWLDGLMHPEWTNPEQYLAVQGLRRLNHAFPDEGKLAVIFQRISDKPTRLPLGVQDPRFCTQFESVRNLLGDWKLNAKP